LFPGLQSEYIFGWPKNYHIPKCVVQKWASPENGFVAFPFPINENGKANSDFFHIKKNLFQ